MNATSTLQPFHPDGCGSSLPNTISRQGGRAIAGKGLRRYVSSVIEICRKAGWSVRKVHFHGTGSVYVYIVADGVKRRVRISDHVARGRPATEFHVRKGRPGRLSMLPAWLEHQWAEGLTGV